MEDLFVADIAVDPRATHDGHAHLNHVDFKLLSPREAMLPQSNIWEQSFHDLRYGSKPEDTMTYQGAALYKTETDWVMRQHYHSYIHEHRRREYLQQKLGQKRDELEEMRYEPDYAETDRRRQQAERARFSIGPDNRRCLLDCRDKMLLSMLGIFKTIPRHLQQSTLQVYTCRPPQQMLLR
ncbi:hypothetical protein G647_02200 [Cladophialophora carrionii CBS 160.54]|uniref:Uncharacterized protein n=1 Tax=Cladophialophora carrionii CBS 160.54 TaxID=1279043 RepID=V9DHL4_9EURO|nr:uncharacterized protein G647_02200 [Cladophialophora carrionii CBS 160.54]ETI25427.1 hypothetical protein G647_02200 [Cladophialophora carrionii CBS 160.54]